MTFVLLQPGNWTSIVFAACFRGLLACLALSIGGTQAHATDERLRVTGVAQNDVLNVRAEPHPTAEKIGSLPHDATDVRAVGKIRVIGTAQWRQIRLGNQTGWVNTHFLTAQSSASPAESAFFREPLSCSGTEPFWGFQLSGRRGELDSLSDGKATFLFDTVRAARGVPIIWSLRGRRQSTKTPVIAIVEETNACSDGMSELIYKYSIRLDVADGPFFAGCCNSHTGQPAP